jgi:glycosyltransferase involved in cell wall biosynthesis
MKVAISTVRPFHAAMLANALVRGDAAVRIYSAAPRRFFRGLAAGVGHTLVPSAVQTAMHLTRLPVTPAMMRGDSWLFDRMVAAVFRPGDMFVGWATSALASGRAAQRRGSIFVLDRACPHVDLQQRMLEEESAALGLRFEPQPAWFRERQLAEYEAADWLLVPSEYTRTTFPDSLRAKAILAPLFGRAPLPAEVRPRRDGVFTVGTVGGDPLRKGYLYLLDAWEQLSLPNARLRIRTDADLSTIPALGERLARLGNVEIVRYVADLNDFYQSCDVFILPSVDDGFGMALFEAMANQVACIATTQCGAAELLSPGRDGLVVPARDAADLARALLSLYRDEEMRHSLGTAGRETALAARRPDAARPYDEAIRSLLAVSGAASQGGPGDVNPAAPPRPSTG